MARLEMQFSPADREAINRAVAAAESLTGAEIIPVIATSSGRYDRSEDLVGLWLAVLSLFVVWLVYPPLETTANSWATPGPGWQFAAYAVAVIGGFLIGAVMASRFDGLRRLFTPRQQMLDEVQARARAVFFDQRVHHTAQSSGVLLYVSLFERMATVLADQKVFEQLDTRQVETWCAELTTRLHNRAVVAALCEMIGLMGQQLAATVPREANDVNELSDALVILD